MTQWRGFAAFLIAFGSLSFVAADKDAKVDYRAVLDKAETFELLSLQPNMGAEKLKDGFHGAKVLGTLEIKDKDVRKKLLDAVYAGIDDKTAAPARCFIPRHGLRAKHDGKTVELVICFECSRVHVHQGEARDSLTTGKAPQPMLDKLLTDAGIELAPKAEK